MFTKLPVTSLDRYSEDSLVRGKVKRGRIWEYFHLSYPFTDSGWERVEELNKTRLTTPRVERELPEQEKNFTKNN